MNKCVWLYLSESIGLLTECTRQYLTGIYLTKGIRLNLTGIHLTHSSRGNIITPHHPSTNTCTSTSTSSQLLYDGKKLRQRFSRPRLRFLSNPLDCGHIRSNAPSQSRLRIRLDSELLSRKLSRPEVRQVRAQRMEIETVTRKVPKEGSFGEVTQDGINEVLIGRSCTL